MLAALAGLVQTDMLSYSLLDKPVSLTRTDGLSCCVVLLMQSRREIAYTGGDLHVLLDR